ncbi:MAG: hypothetical protein ED556_11925 [Winogradskyella sp.]|uniref:hypothetical protein n=1 Tax=Winogradskyella sp. TaxID=1883156 RepID=UPI000F3F9B9F|nr:hypothetical protein [Winogradskyella sp.]RNC84159.1 MAG: hypothetical protein ED556_11925 [Winogradskyella sp.]
MNKFKTIIVALLVISCASDDRETIIINNTNLLSEDLENRSIELNSVIACAASDSQNSNVVEIYFYSEEGASNFKLYETNSVTVDSGNFSNYRFVDLETSPFFNGFLDRFIRSSASEQWIIVTYELDGEIKISQPIRTKNVSQPTTYSNNVAINQDITTMPIFNWDINSDVDNAIFFQVMSTLDNGVLSGTYTLENQFQYYNTSNVVLNITEQIPPALTSGIPYKFTVMDVSSDNWVNAIFTLDFIAE